MHKVRLQAGSGCGKCTANTGFLIVIGIDIGDGIGSGEEIGV